MDRKQVEKWWEVFKNWHELTEIRIIGQGKTFSGYFSDVDTLMRCVEPYDTEGYQVYFTLNKVDTACDARQQLNRIIRVNREPTTSDGDIIERTHVLIDLDPKRPAGVSASNEELEMAHRKAVAVYNYLLDQGFTEPIVARSGNGYHVVVPCHMPSTPETTELMKNFLRTLSVMFSDSHVEVDEKVFNAARICKLYGTTARKGASTPDRPWRLAEIIRVPEDIQPTPRAYFEKVAKVMMNDEPRRSAGQFNLEEFLHRHGIVYKDTRVAGGTKYILDHCPFNENHKGKDAAIFRSDSGAIGFFCFHNSCSGKTWRDVRLLFEPDAYTEKYRPQRFTTTPTPPPPIVETDEKGKVWLSMADVRKQPFSPDDFIPSGITGIDKRGIGFKRGMVSVWTGKRGCGKSSLLNMLILNAAQRGFKSALWTGELTADMVKQWLYLQAAGKRYNHRVFGTDYYITADTVIPDIDSWMDDKMRLYNNNYGENFQTIEQQVRTLHGEWGVDNVLLDNLMVLDIKSLDEEKYDRQGVLMQRLVDLAKELNIHIHLVAHPHKSLGYVRIDNIGGSGDISNKADNVFIMSRVNNDFKATAGEFLEKSDLVDIVSSGCTNIIEIAKFRAKGTLMGDIVKLWFEEESNRLKNYDTENIVYNWNNNQEEI